MASRMLSVPPDDTVPQTWRTPASPPPSIAPVMATISASYLTALGHSSGCSGLACELMA